MGWQIRLETARLQPTRCLNSAVSASMSRVWPGIVVAEENLKVQISALRKALGEDRDFIRTVVPEEDHARVFVENARALFRLP